MSLQFVFGRAGSGKSEYCIKQASLAETKGKRVIMIVPEQYSHQGESAFLREKGYIHDDFHVTSFGRLAKKLIASSGVRYKATDSAGKAMLVLKAIMGCKSDLRFYRSAAEKPGYISLFMDTISEFKKGQITPEALRLAADDTEEHLFSARLRDLACIYEEYNKLLSEDLCDSDDDLTVMADLARANEYIQDAIIFIDAFYRFTQNELSCIRAFLACGAEVIVSLCMPDGDLPETSVFQSVARSKRLLERLAQDVGAPVLPPVVLGDAPRYRSRELKGLERALSGERIRFTEDTVCDISLYIGKGKYEEVVRTAAAIRDYVAKTNTPYRDIAVIAGDYDGYADLIQTVFPAYEIPVFADIRHDFLSHPIVLYLFSLFDLLLGINTKSVTSYMKSGFADISADDAARLENYALAGAIEYGDWLNDARFMHKISGVFAKEEQAGDTETDYLLLKNQVLTPVLQLKEQFMESKCVKDRVCALLSFFEAQQLAEKISVRAEEFKQKGLLRYAEEFIEVYNILIETLDMMVYCLGNETIGISGMRAVLEAGLSQKSIGVIPTVYDQVSFGDLNRSVIKNVRALFILGANDGVFPSVPSANALLSDSEREFLNARGISVAPDAKRLISDAEFSVYAAATISREKLFVSYSVSEDNGGGMRPAMFVSKLRRAFPALVAQHELDLDEPSCETTVASKQSAYNYVLTHIDALGKNETVDRLYHALMPDPAYSRRLTRALEYAQFKNTPGKLAPDTIQALYGDTLYGSVSRFERYSACPFSFFIEYGLKAKERKILKVEAPDIGSLLHEIIERFSMRLRMEGKSFRSVTKDEQRTITDAILDEMFGAMYIKNIYGAGRLDALKNRLKRLVSKSVWALCEHVARGEFEPAAFEIAFEKNGEMPPVKVPLPQGGEVVLTGRIDRIDTLRHEGSLYLKIIDYKSGSKGYSLADIFNGTTLQLSVYMLAATEGMAASDSKPVRFGGMFYFRLDDPILDSTPEQEADEETVLKSFKMSGLSSDDPAIIRAIDCNAKGWSAVIPVYIKADGSVSKSQSKTAGAEEFEKLKRYVRNTVTKIGQEIMDGNVDIRPVRDGKPMPCTYCKYLPVCGYDPNLHPCRRTEQFRSDEEIWSKMN